MKSIYKQGANKWLIAMIYYLKDSNPEVMDASTNTDGFMQGGACYMLYAIIIILCVLLLLKVTKKILKVGLTLVIIACAMPYIMQLISKM